jgi:hypothetical protein
MMVNLRRIGLISMPLRAAFAILFFTFAATQPSLLAAAGTQGVVHGAAVQAEAGKSGAPHAGEHGAKHTHADQDDESAASHDDSASGKSCEVHCAPAHAIPVECPEIAPVVTRCFIAIVSDSLPLGHSTVHIRPPRRLT